jgi:protein-tyrosine phosphatase
LTSVSGPNITPSPEQAPLSLRPAQAIRLSHFEAPMSADVHCHCLFGLDDGPPTLEDALSLCRALVEDGITHVVATPHQLGRYDRRNAPEEVQAVAAQLRSALASHEIPLVIEVGADVRIDERLAMLLRQKQVLTVGGAGKYLLLELPHDVFLNPRRAITDLRKEGVSTILTHPERHVFLQQNPETIRPWLDQGVVVQITAGSILGDFGESAQQAAWDLLKRGWVGVVATDAHDTVRRPPRITAAADVISKQFSHAIARRLCVENPARIWAGQPLVSLATRRTLDHEAASLLRAQRTAGRWS